MSRCLIPMVMALLVSTACASPTPPPLPTPVPTALGTSRATALPTGTPRPTATRRPTLTTTASPSPAAALPRVIPYLDAYRLWPVGWSPDSQWLAYRTFTPDDASLNPYEGTSILPYGTFHFLNVRTGQTCAYSKDNTYDLAPNRWHGWLPDGRLMTLDRAGQVVVLEAPCAGDTAALLRGSARPRCLVTNPDSGQSCSPDGRRLGFTDETRDPRTTTITNLDTGQVEAVITWPPAWAGLGHVGGPIWLDSQRFILQSTHAGPVLVTLGETVLEEHLAPAYFGVEGNHSQWVSAVLLPGSHDGHLLLNEPAHDGVNGQVLLYHPENGLVETLPAYSAEFRPDGRWLDLRDDDNDPAWLRPVDPPSSAPREWLANASEAQASLSNDLTRVAVSHPAGADGPGGLRVYSRATGTLLQSHGFRHYAPSVAGWSPDDHFLIVIGYAATGEQALYIIEVAR